MQEPRANQAAATVAASLSDVVALLGADPSTAANRAQNILKIAPGQPHALTLLVSAHRAAGDKAAALAELETLARAQPNIAAIQYELGLLLISLKQDEKAIAALSRVTELEPHRPKAWRLLAGELAKAGRIAEAGKAYSKHFAISATELKSLDGALAAGDGSAEAMLSKLVSIRPTDISLRLILAEASLRLNRFREAEKRLMEILRLAPGFALARYTLALAFYKQTKLENAIVQLDILLNEDADNLACLNLKALSLIYLGDYDRGVACYERLLDLDPNLAACWVGYGHALKTVGRVAGAVAAFKKAIALQPSLGEAYWQLADLKTFRFAPAESEAMRKELARPSLVPDDRAQLHFALGKALEDVRDYAASFQEYAKGNAVRRATVQYSADKTAERIRRSKAAFTADFFRAHKGAGCAAPDPIFIVGLTRSGSTLIEQILASHPLIEGAKELPTIEFLAMQLRKRNPAKPLPEIVRSLDASDFRKIGEDYIARTRIHRKLARPLFVDKMPSNFLHLGLLHLILPNAKVVDTRRHPLGCGFANFKQHFTRGQPWSYDLVEIGRYYRDYVDLMAHFDSVLPGRVHRISYESMVANSESEVRQLLAYCGVPFDEACLRFYENGRPVLTASAEQVRRPIFRDSLEQWRNFEPWLDPLKATLGDILDSYPGTAGAEAGQRSGI